jgi:hypothetical protein
MSEREATEQSSTTVFRPLRRCQRCGLVNASGATRCRRCHRSFDDVNPGAESERLVARIRARRLALVGLAVALVVGLTGIGAAVWWRANLHEQFDADARSIDADLRTLARGSRTDAAAIVRAFDEREARAALADQSGAWAERARRCETLRARLEQLVPRSADETKRQMDLQARLTTLENGVYALSRAAAADDLLSGRAAAQILTDS